MLDNRSGLKYLATTSAKKKPKKESGHRFHLERSEEKSQDILFILCELGVSAFEFEAIARATLNDGFIIFNAREVDFDDAMNLLEASWTRCRPSAAVLHSLHHQVLPNLVMFSNRDQYQARHHIGDR